MRLQFMSDLHLNNYSRRFEIEPNAPNLALIGDICEAFDKKLYEFLLSVSNQYEKILYIPGNHEYYENTIEDVDSYLSEVCCELDIEYLQKKSIEIDGVILSGCTLWSSPAPESFYKTDENRWIKNFDRERMVMEYNKHLDFIQKEIKLNRVNKPHILLTHYAPMYEMNGKYITAPYTDMFASDLKYIFKPPIKYWLCGHVHQNLTIIHNEIPCITNCLGNPDEIDVNETFDIRKYIEV